MKENTEELKEALKKALKKVPNDFALFEVKRYINLAITKIESIENRREKRSAKSEERKALRIDSERGQ
jgi:hypothetical protein